MQFRHRLGPGRPSHPGDRQHFVAGRVLRAGYQAQIQQAELDRPRVLAGVLIRHAVARRVDAKAGAVGVRAGVRSAHLHGRDRQADFERVVLLQPGPQVDRRQGAVFGNADERAVPQPGFQPMDDELIVAQGVRVDVDRPQAPVVMDVPSAALAELVVQVPAGRLKVVRPEEHAFVPIDGRFAHGDRRRSGVARDGNRDDTAPRRGRQPPRP